MLLGMFCISGIIAIIVMLFYVICKLIEITSK